MKYKNILVPFDYSDAAQHAFAAALDLARDGENVSVTVLSVSDSSASFEVAARMAGVNPDEAKTTQVEALKKLLRSSLQKSLAIQEASEVLASFNVEAVSGKPQEAIPAFATEHACDLIVMGSRGLGGMKGIVGSVSKAVLSAVEIPVFVVK